MPDRDIVRSGVNRRFRKVYQQTCEGSHDDEYLAHEALGALKSVLRASGNEPIRLIEQVAGQLDQIRPEPLFKHGTDWGEQDRQIDRAAREIGGDPWAKELAKEACKQQLVELQYRESPQSNNDEILSNYVRKVYNAAFAECAPMGQPPNGLSQSYIEGRLSGMEPHVERGIRSFARQLSKGSDVRKLRRPSRQNKFEISLDTDLLSGNG